MSLLLTANIGNTSTHIGLFEADELVGDWRVSSDERRTSDEWAVLARGLLVDVRPSELGGVAVCSAVPSVLHAWREMLARHLPRVPSLVVEPGVRTGLSILMDNPREVGADRIMNALAATRLYGGPAIVVDFGTATTFDVVDAAGAFVGGAIAPGLEISLDALGRRGAQLRTVELSRPRVAIAKNTVDALRSGLVFGAAAQVEGLVDRMIAELGDPPALSVIATGELAPLVVADADCFSDHDPLLTLRGLGLAFARNHDHL